MSQNGPTSGSKKSEIQSREMEDLRKYFESATQDKDLMKRVYHLHHWVAEIIRIWQIRADGDDPTDYSLSFKTPGVTVTLRQVLALVPDEYQDQIKLEGARAFRSWLDENLMDVLVELFVEEAAPGAHFARCLATDCNTKLDNIAASEGGFKSRLAYLIDQQKRNLPDWNIGGFYTVPTDTDRIVFFWNYYESHWTVISIDIDSGLWKYNVYDSSGCPETIHSISRRGLPLGRLIRAASNMKKPETPVFKKQNTAQQDNFVDCGVYAVDNVIHILKKEPVEASIDPFKRRVTFLRKILHALRDGRGVNNWPKPSAQQQPASDGKGTSSSTSKLTAEKQDSIDGKGSDSSTLKLSPREQHVSDEKGTNSSISKLSLEEQYVSTELSISDPSCFLQYYFFYLLKKPSCLCKASAHPKLRTVLISYSGEPPCALSWSKKAFSPNA